MEEIVKDINLKEIYDNHEFWTERYRFFKNGICFEKMNIIDYDMENKHLIVMDIFKNKPVEYEYDWLFNMNTEIIENHKEYFLILEEEFFDSDYTIYKLDMDIEKINKLKLLITI